MNKRFGLAPTAQALPCRVNVVGRTLLCVLVALVGGCTPSREHCRDNVHLQDEALSCFALLNRYAELSKSQTQSEDDFLIMALACFNYTEDEKGCAGRSKYLPNHLDPSPPPQK